VTDVAEIIMNSCQEGTIDSNLGKYCPFYKQISNLSHKKCLIVRTLHDTLVTLSNDHSKVGELYHI